MDKFNHNTSSNKNKHFTYDERCYLQRRLGVDSISNIAKELSRSRSTIYTEIDRGLVTQRKNGEEQRIYFADVAQRRYENSRQGSFSALKIASAEQFIEWIEIKVFKENWSFDAAVGYAKVNNLFEAAEMVCTKTLYNYLHLGLLNIKPIDLPMIVKMSQKKKHDRKNKRKLGDSIDKRPESVLTREEFGHWEIDTVRGTKDKTDEVLVTLAERKSRFYVTLRCPSAKAVDVKATLEGWLKSITKPEYGKICKSITSDNGSEFAQIGELKTEEMGIYFAHPYSSWERGTNERHNGLLRRFVPKGKAIKDVGDKILRRCLEWCNNLPRKILNYRTPQEVFLEEVMCLMDL